MHCLGRAVRESSCAVLRSARRASGRSNSARAFAQDARSPSEPFAPTPDIGAPAVCLFHISYGKVKRAEAVGKFLESMMKVAVGCRSDEIQSHHRIFLNQKLPGQRFMRL